MFWCSDLVRVSRAMPASRIGFLVVPCTTIRSIWTWHIWKGMSEKACLKPPNPSPVIDMIVYPRCSRYILPSRYTDVVSVCLNVHHRSSFLFGSRNTTAHQLVFSVRSPKYRASTTKSIFLGSWVFSGALYDKRTSFNVLLSLPCSCFSSLSVCLPKTYSFHTVFWKLVLSRLLFLNFFPHSLQLQVCMFLSTPLFFVLVPPQWGHFLCFFSHGC